MEFARLFSGILDKAFGVDDRCRRKLYRKGLFKNNPSFFIKIVYNVNMIKIKFEYNLKKDAYNWISQVIFRPRIYIPLEIQEEIQKEIKRLYEINKISHIKLIESMDHSTIDFMVDYLKKNQNMDLIERKKEELEKAWRKGENDFFKILSEIIQKPIYKASYVCYLSTICGCPFYEKENWFMVSLSKLNIQVYIVAHEFMHLQFIYWYKKYCLDNGLTNKQFWHIQEAITFLLNEPEFSNIIKFDDPGYPIHKNLRKQLKEIWQKDKNFQNFLNKAIEIVKKEFPND